jgi:hypothetical protein
MYLPETDVLARWPMLSDKELRQARRKHQLTFYAFASGPHYTAADVEAFIDRKYRRSAEPPAPRPPSPPPLPPLPPRPASTRTTATDEEIAVLQQQYVEGICQDLRTRRSKAGAQSRPKKEKPARKAAPKPKTQRGSKEGKPSIRELAKHPVG